MGCSGVGAERGSDVHGKATALSNRNPAAPDDSGFLANVAATLILLVAVIIFGTIAYEFRQQWWEMYLSYIR